MKSKLQELLDKKYNRKYLLLFLLFGIMLMFFPTKNDTEIEDAPAVREVFSLEGEEKRLQDVLSSIQGVGNCRVLLSVHSGEELILAEDEEGTVVISNGKTEEPITITTIYPNYQGAVIVMGGYDDANIRFDVLSAVMSYTGLSTDKITICPLKE